MPRAKRQPKKITKETPAENEPSYVTYEKSMQKLGLDWQTIALIAEEYTSGGDDDLLVLTIVLLQRLANLMKKDAPETLDNYLPLLIDRMYAKTLHCELASEAFAVAADQALREKRIYK